MPDAFALFGSPHSLARSNGRHCEPPTLCHCDVPAHCHCEERSGPGRDPGSNLAPVVRAQLGRDCFVAFAPRNDRWRWRRSDGLNSCDLSKND
jgi:hypothetical protein